LPECKTIADLRIYGKSVANWGYSMVKYCFLKENRMVNRNVMWTALVYQEIVHWSNDACNAVASYRERPDIFERRTTITGEELVAGIRAAITPIFLRDYNREPTAVECSYGLVASKRCPA
jgi:hypothetical protein